MLKKQRKFKFQNLIRSKLSILVCFLWFFTGASQALAVNDNLLGGCLRTFLGTGGVPPKQVQGLTGRTAHKIESLDDLLLAFTRGFVPDLKDPDQLHAFEIYKKMRFGNPDTKLNPGSLALVAEELKNHPELTKEPFSSQRMIVQERIYPVSKELEKFTDSQLKSAGQVRSRLFQIEANLGDWKKILNYEEPSDVVNLQKRARDTSLGSKIRKEAQKSAKVLSKKHFLSFLDAEFSPKTRAMLLDKSVGSHEKIKKLYQALNKILRQRLVKKQDHRALTQAMVDLVHTTGFHDPSITKAMKSSDGLERLGGYRRILEERDSMAMELDFEDHFSQVLRDLNINKPTGIDSEKGLSARLQAFENEVVSNSKFVSHDQPGSSSVKTIRPLSIVEAPFRSCIGGSDCSSRTYFTKALDPNYHYFTLTDEQGFSSGHITIVLGEAKVAGKKVKVAFIDKVQNVDNVDLPVMIEGVRRSVLEKGYKLTLPENLGDQIGISNESVTRNFIGRSILTHEDKLMTGYKPHSHSYSFPNKYSRAYQKLPMREVLPLGRTKRVKIETAGIIEPWGIKKLDLKKLVKASIKLKDGSLDDQLRYIPSMQVVKKAGLRPDPKFPVVLDRWLKGSKTPFKLKKQVLLHRWFEEKKTLSSLLAHFPEEERLTLISNFLDTPRFRKNLLDQESQFQKDLPRLMVLARSNKKLVSRLNESYAMHSGELVSLVLSAKDVPDRRALKALREIKKNGDSLNIDELIRIQKILHRTSVEEPVQAMLLDRYVSGIHSDAALGRELAASLESKDRFVKSFGMDILKKATRDDSLQRYPVAKAYGEFLRRMQKESKAGRDSSFVAVARDWMQDSRQDPKTKASFLMTQVGSGRGQFDRYLKLVPRNQKDLVFSQIEKQTMLGVFRDLARKQDRLLNQGDKLEEILFDDGVLESFQFKTIISQEQAKKGGVTFTMREENQVFEATLTKPYELQVTTMTQLQISLLTGNNPSKFTDLGKVIKIGKKRVKIDPNRPVEQISWEDIQEQVVKKLNELAREANSPYEYDLPTEAQWEYAARGGTKTKFSFGESDADMAHFGWTYRTSGDKTHKVAKLRPNLFGLHDMHGNVREWVKDWYGDYPQGSVTDPSGPRSGTVRVLRGGSWNLGAQSASSALRYYDYPGDRSSHVGFRLLRRPRQ